MPRYLVERTFPEGLHVPMNDAGATAIYDTPGDLAAALDDTPLA